MGYSNSAPAKPQQRGTSTNNMMNAVQRVAVRKSLSAGLVKASKVFYFKGFAIKKKINIPQVTPGAQGRCLVLIDFVCFLGVWMLYTCL